MRVFGTRGVSLSMAGWLWADLLLGLFAIFLAASAVASASAPRPAGIDPKPLELRVQVDGAALLGSDPIQANREKERVAAELASRVTALAPGRHAAIVFAYGASARASDGDRMATLATEGLGGPTFRGTLVKAYHELVAGDQGTSIAFEIYFDE